MRIDLLKMKQLFATFIENKMYMPGMKPLDKCLVGLICFSAFFSYHDAQAQPTDALKNKKVLVVYGGWPNHYPEKFVALILPWLKQEGALVDTTSSTSIYANEKYMAAVDLVIQSITMSHFTQQEELGLTRAVKNGTGIAGCHGGLGDSFRENTEYQFMVGGQFVSHPGGVIDYRVHIKNKKDAITKGLSDFNVKTEQYYMHVDPNNHVLATTTFGGQHAPWIAKSTMPVVWKKYYGKGRVFYSSIGHLMTDFDVPETFELLKRGIRWSALSKYEPAESWVKPVY